MSKKRDALLLKLWEAQDEAYDLMVEYDSLPHHYGKNILFQAEGHIIDLIAVHPGVTVTDLSNILKKTPSACSQIVRKLREKKYVEQTRNYDNNRLYNLTLTPAGEQIYADHVAFSQECQSETFRLLDEFSEEELEAHLKVQKKLNQAYKMDVWRSRSKLLAGKKEE